MKIIIPMAGYGDRFVKAGYKAPKPLVEVNGKMIIEYVLDTLDNQDDIIFICNHKHLQETNIKDVLISLAPNSKVIGMPNHKLGPVHTTKQAYDFIEDEEEVIVAYCDSPYKWDREDFKRHVKTNQLDGCILSHIGFHPHTLNKTKMAFIKEKNGLVDEIKEKECYTDDPMKEHASTGAYYFKKGKYIKKYFDLAIKKNINYAGEFHVTLVYNLLIQDGLKVGYYDTPFATVMGTPEEIKNFESWANILTKGQISDEEDLLNCYRYWKSYHKL